MLPLRHLIALLAAVGVSAQTPPEEAIERLLPPDTLAVFCVPDWRQSSQAFEANPWRQLWMHDTLAPLRTALSSNLVGSLLDSARQRLGVDPRSHAGVLGGQLALAIVGNPWAGADPGGWGWLLVINGRDREEAIDRLLENLRGGARERGAVLQETRISSAAFVAVPSPGTTNRAEPTASLPAQPAHNPLLVGRARHFLLAGSSSNLLAGLVARIEGVAGPCLADQSAFAADAPARPPATPTAYGWANLRPLVDTLQTRAKEADLRETASPIPMPKRALLLEATGLTCLQSAGFRLLESPQGTLLELGVRAPAASRRGLLQVFELTRAEGSPPTAVPIDALSYQRVRLDFRRSWIALESMVTNVFPNAVSLLQLVFETQDAAGNKVDSKPDLLNSLGNDFVRWTPRPPTNTVSPSHLTPAVCLVASTNPARLARGLETFGLLLPQPWIAAGERVVGGRKVQTLSPAGSSGGASGTNPPAQFHYGTTSDHLAWSGDASLLAYVLQTNGPPADGQLLKLPGLSEAAARVGGTDGGLFGYLDLAALVGGTMERLRGGRDGLRDFLDSTPLGPPPEAWLDRAHAWLRPDLVPRPQDLPPVRGFLVFAGEATPQGFNFRAFGPRVGPAALPHSPNK